MKNDVNNTDVFITPNKKAKCLMHHKGKVTGN